MARAEVGETEHCEVSAKPAGRYHHGRLRDALILATLRLVRDRGPAGFTLKDAASAAGVSPAAPYRHFSDREHLLAAAAVPGYQELWRRLSAVAHSEPGAGLASLMEAFVRWAVDDPATHRILFASGLDKSRHPELRAIGDAAVALFVEAARVVIPSDSRAAARLMVSAFAIAQGHVAIIDDPSVAADGVVTETDVAPLTHAAVLALVGSVRG